WQGHVAWGRKPTTSTGLLVNAKLNLIFPAPCHTAPLRALAAEYAYHPHFVRRILQRTYVHHAVSRPLRRLFSSAWVDISPWPDAVSDWCILPGNHSIRIVDRVQNECIVLRKTGFNPALLDNVVRIRQDFPELPGPRLLEANSEQGWYREQRIAGLPLNRLADVARMQRSLDAARQEMVGVYQRTLLMEPVSEWLDDRLQHITAAVVELPAIYGVEIRERILGLAQGLAHRLRRQIAAADGMALPTALTHGDFQPANILVPAWPEAGPVYVIDWEYGGRRCVWYDALVFELRSRFPSGLSGRIAAWQQDTQQQQASLAWFGEAVAGWNAATCISTFLLEDLLLRLIDTTIPELRRKETGFMCFIDELSRLEGKKV
uniref:phosphotransferase family protein n=1 Tax=Porticoccus sp. TaxID=2024853 RepID=UPI003F69C3A8